jgi:predicted RNase H-like nuclease (RuvC/YqgF family)
MGASRGGDTNQPQKEDTRSSSEETTSQIITLEKENKRMRAQIAKLEGQLAANHRETQDGFGTHGRRFSTTANSTSIADVGRMVDELDAEIFQIAAALSDHDFRGKVKKINATAHQRVDSELHSCMTRILGGELVNLLSANNRSHATPEILVQIALQTAISSWSYMLLGAWVMGTHSDDSDRFLVELYGEICRSGE